MKILKTSRLQAFSLAVLSLVLLGCPEANSPVGVPVPPPLPAPPAKVAAQPPSVDVAAIERNLQDLRHGMRNQELRIEETREAIQGITDEVERARKDSEVSLEKADKVLAKLKQRIEKLENEVSRLRTKPPLVAAEKKEKVVVTPVGAPSRLSPVGAPPADSRIPSAGLPLSQDAQDVGVPAPDTRVAVVPKEPPSQPQKSARVPRLPDPEEEYIQAIRVLRDERNFTKARGLLKSFIEKYPTHELTDDAYYSIGQSFFQEKNCEEALVAFVSVRMDYANGDRAPEALFKEASCHLMWGDSAHARDLFDLLIRRYPDSSAAGKALKRLESL
ncbi:MAG: tetratricopeptide repeat protein [Nitrospinae bacterium]|nr:tetratricopeptide repeat protein [Nitrospinota bacterium]